MKILIQSFSSGIDSTTTIYKAMKDENFDLVIPINYNYGQKNVVETKNQEDLIITIQKTFPNKILDVVSLDLEPLFNSGFYSKLRDSKKIKEKTGTEYYTPFRNLLFSTIAAMIGELYVLSQDEEIELYVGLGIHKHTNVYEKDYWDITPKFASELQQLFSLNDNVKTYLYTPYKDVYKTDIIKDVIRLNVPYKETWTCYNPSIKDGVAIPCLECEACLEREKAFKSMQLNDGNNYKVQL